MLHFYSLSAEDGRKKTFHFDTLRNKVVLIVNVASLCGFTPQYKDLEYLYEKYNEAGLEIIAFPCNQFGGQEPELQQNIENFVRETFHVSFPVMTKTSVNGDETHPVYEFLKKEKAGALGFRGIRWNFEKFLIDRRGNVTHRFVSAVVPKQMEPAISELLRQT